MLPKSATMTYTTTNWNRPIAAVIENKLCRQLISGVPGYTIIFEFFIVKITFFVIQTDSINCKSTNRRVNPRNEYSVNEFMQIFELNWVYRLAEIRWIYWPTNGFQWNCIQIPSRRCFEWGLGSLRATFRPIFTCVYTLIWLESPWCSLSFLKIDGRIGSGWWIYHLFQQIVSTCHWNGRNDAVHPTSRRR